MRVRPLAFAVALLALAAARPARAEEEEKPDPIDATRGYVGYKPGLVQSLSEENRKETGITRGTGIYVHEVVPGSPAAKAGLAPNDVVLKINGADIDVSKIDKDDKEAYEKWQKEVFKAITSKIKPGDKVEMVVDRKGKTITIEPIAMTKADYDFLTQLARDDENWGAVPDPAAAGSAKPATFDFEGLEDGKMRPDDLYGKVGLWMVDVEAEGSKNHVLRQDESIPTSERPLAIVTGEGHSYSDATVSCRAKLMGGELSVSAGILFRVRARGDGYVALADGVTKTLSIVAMEKGKSRVVASAPLGSPKLKEWHTLSVTFAGKKIEAAFDSTKVSGEDGVYTAGWAGVAVDKDAKTDFDDWKAVPAK